MILCDWSSRDLQMDDLALRLGQAKGKDGANSLGPVLVTPDELEPYWRVPNVVSPTTICGTHYRAPSARETIRNMFLGINVHPHVDRSLVA
jgi:hypothetical protein